MALNQFYFAWVGGDIIPSTVLQTKGDLHGGLPKTFSTTGDLDSALSTVNIASTAGLVLGQIYGIAAVADIVPGTMFVYGGAHTNLLSDDPTVTASSVTLTITEPIVVKNTVADLSAGSTTILNIADTAGLVVNEWYGIRGEGILTGSIFEYLGGNSANTTIGFTGAPQFSSLTATAMPITISGIPGTPTDVVSNIAASLSGLTTGAQYDISGGGIPTGATFLAPSSGSSVTLDLAPTLTAIGVPITISGPRTPDADFDAVADLREDEQILSIEIAQSEGDAATLRIEIVNPRVGLLATGRQIWAWLAWDSGSGVIPLFNGRLLGIPQDLQAETVALQFLAKPDDYAAQKSALADAMRVLPFYDPVWVAAKQDDPDTVLEGYSKLWHTDRASLAVTASDIIDGEDGTVTIDVDQHFYDEMRLAYGQPPLTQISVTGTVTWTQQGDGVVDLTQSIVQPFRDAGSPYTLNLICSLTGGGLFGAWPKASQNIGDGWSMTSATDLVAPSSIVVADWVRPVAYTKTYQGQPTLGIGGNPLDLMYSAWTEIKITFPLGVYAIKFGVSYAANRRRTETVSFALQADVQSVLSEPAGADHDTLALNSDYVGQPVDDTDASIPIGDLRRNSYFKTDRGARSFEALLMMARAKLLARSRAAQITFGCSFATAVPLTLRKNVHLVDPRLPGGFAVGKIVSYRLMVDDKAGMRASVVLGCAIGRGNSVSAQIGTPVYANAGYVNAGYQAVAYGESMLGTGDISYESFDDFLVADDGLDLFNMVPNTVIDGLTVDGTLDLQVEAINAALLTLGMADPVGALKRTPTVITLDLKPLSGDFHTDFQPAVSILAVPKMIDLGAA